MIRVTIERLSAAPAVFEGTEDQVQVQLEAFFQKPFMNGTRIEIKTGLSKAEKRDVWEQRQRHEPDFQEAARLWAENSALSVKAISHIIGRGYHTVKNWKAIARARKWPEFATRLSADEYQRRVDSINHYRARRHLPKAAA